MPVSVVMTKRSEKDGGVEGGREGGRSGRDRSEDGAKTLNWRSDERRKEGEGV